VGAVFLFYAVSSQLSAVSIIMKDYSKLEVWKKSHKLVLNIYKITNTFPKIEDYRLSNQLTRSVSSIATNIAEGCGRGSDSDFARFLQMAIGSCSEAEYQVLLAKDLKYIDNKIYDSLTQAIKEIRMMLNGLRKKLKADSRLLKAPAK
jgi:four helix bundle protein